MIDKTALARSAITKALRLRQENKIKLYDALCVYDIAEDIFGIKIRFDAIPSLEGMYVNGNPSRIILSSLRPVGRMWFSCAHELGHHVFGHGTHVDKLRTDKTHRQFIPEEYVADCFASFILMPKLAVSNGFTRRNWAIDDCTPEQLFTVACWLGVGYTTLAKHMAYSLNLIPRDKSKELCKVNLKTIKHNLLGDISDSDLIIVDEKWSGRPVDVPVGSLILASSKVQFEGHCLKPKPSLNKNIFKAIRPGLSRFYSDDGKWATYVRVSRSDYTGQCRYRHLEEPEDE